MPNLWTLNEFDVQDPIRARHLRRSPPWPELVEAVCAALRVAMETKYARFGIDESGRDAQDLRGVIQFPLGASLFDWLFNSTTGYRAQFRIGRANGLAMNAQLISEIRTELNRFSTTDVVVHTVAFASPRSANFPQFSKGNVYGTTNYLVVRPVQQWKQRGLLVRKSRLRHRGQSRPSAVVLVD